MILIKINPIFKLKTRKNPVKWLTYGIYVDIFVRASNLQEQVKGIGRF
jgi:hypothetical protein